MLTCFISIDNLESTYQKVLLWIFLIIPLFSFAFGGIQVYLIMKSPEYKNNENNRNFFVEYSYFVITYIISSILIILTYIIYYIIIHTDISGIENEFYRAFICIVTFLTCSTPLIVGIIRFWRTGLLKRLIRCSKKRSNNINERGKELIDLIDENRDNSVNNCEKKC